jgi:hypothetical protein
MATVTRLFENRVQTTVGTVYSPSVDAFLFTIKKGDTVAVDLRAEDDAVNETVEVIVREFNPLAYFITDDASGKIHMILDKGNTAAELQIRLRRIADSIDDGSTVGVNLVDISGSTVAAAASITIA